MSNSNHVERVTVIVETGNGEYHKLVTERPSPGGDNPRFMGQQFDTAITELARRVDDLLVSQYGDQIRGKAPLTNAEKLAAFGRTATNARR